MDYFGGGAASSGVKVSNQSALKYTPFWAGVRVITGILSALPFITYRRTDGGKERAPDNPVYALLRTRPNPYMSAQDFTESRQAHALCYGNGYAEIQRDGAGRPVALWPLLPNKTVRKIDDSGVPFYEVTVDSGEKIPLADYNVLHIKGLGFDGYTGYNVVQYQKEAIGYGVAVKQYGSRFFSQDASPAGTLECPVALSDKAFKRMNNDWIAKHTGLEQKHRMQILEEGTKWNQTGVDPKQAQALEVQKYTVDDAARILLVPPHKLASMASTSFKNIEEQNIDFYSSTMLYWFGKWEQEVNFKLFSPNQQKTFFAEILVAALLRGSLEAQAKLFASGRQNGYLSINDIHRMLNMNGIGPDGDVYLDPLNMAPAGSRSVDSLDDDDDDDDDDDVRQAIRSMIAGQFRRVITKQTRDGFRPQQGEWARTILTEPVRAYTLSTKQSETRAQAVLNQTITEFITETKPLNDSHADQFADRVIKLLGGPNGQEN